MSADAYTIGERKFSSKVVRKKFERRFFHSYAFNDRRNRHPRTGAHCDDAMFNVASVHFVHQRTDQNRAGRSHRVAHCNCATGNVDPFERHFGLVR